MQHRKQMKLPLLVFAGLALLLWPSIWISAVPDINNKIKEAEGRIDSALWELEERGKLTDALEKYQAVAAALEGMKVDAQSSEYREQQRVLAYAYLRIGNALRQLNRGEEALQMGKRELECARESGDDIAFARTLMNFGTTLLTGGQVEKGLSYIEQSRPIFENGTSFDHKQGLGWYWILKAELGLVGLIKAEPQDLQGFLDTALETLKPIENWAGVARAYELRAKVNETLGRADAAANDRKLHLKYKARVEEETEQQ